MTIEPLSTLPRDSASGRAPARRRLPRTYVAAWTVLTAISGTYLVQQAARGLDLPDTLTAALWSRTGSSTTPKPQQQASVAGAEAASAKAQAIAEESTKLRAALADFQADVGRLRVALEQRGADPAIIGSLSALEERASIDSGIPLMKQIAAAAIEAPPAPAPAAPMPAFMPGIAASSGPASSAVEAVQLPSQLQKPIETGSLPDLPVRTVPALSPERTVVLSSVATPTIADANTVVQKSGTNLVAKNSATQPGSQPEIAAVAPITFGPAVVKPAPKPFAVQLGQGASLEAIRLSWSLLAERNGDALRNLQPRYTATPAGDAGEVFDLVAGPVKSAADARKICKIMAARGIGCKVSPFGGNELL